MLLAISTAHDACSVALIADGSVLAAAHEVIGRGHDARLVPLVAEVLEAAGGGRPDEIWVDIGPGSFTGIRVGIAAARGLGIAWRVDVRGLPGDRLVASAAFAGDPGLEAVAVLLDARRGEVFGRVHYRSGAAGNPMALAGDALARFAPGLPQAGNGLVGGRAPVAADARLLAPSDLGPPTPIYVRPPDVTLPS